MTCSALTYSAIGSVWLVSRADWAREVEKAQERQDGGTAAAGGGETRGLLADVVEEDDGEEI